MLGPNTRSASYNPPYLNRFGDGALCDALSDVLGVVGCPLICSAVLLSYRVR
jgi:hypothetical protein